MNKESKEYTNTWFTERGGKTWEIIFGDKDIKTALEIGCYEGQASVYMLNKFPKMKLLVMDIFDADKAEDWDGYIDDYETRFDVNTKQYKSRVYKYKGKSIFGLTREIIDGGSFDFIYVDGDHRALPAMQDCVLAIELLNPDGIMLIDDYAGIPWLKDAVDKFVSLLPEDKYTYKTTPDGEQMVIRKV